MVLINRDNLTSKALARRRAKGGRYPPFVKASTRTAVEAATQRTKRVGGIYTVYGLRMPGNTRAYNVTYNLTGTTLEVTGESHIGKHQMLLPLANRSEIMLFEIVELFLTNMDHYSALPDNGQSVADFVESDYSKRPRRWMVPRPNAPVVVKRLSGRGIELPIKVAYQKSFWTTSKRTI